MRTSAGSSRPSRPSGGPPRPTSTPTARAKKQSSSARKRSCSGCISRDSALGVQLASDHLEHPGTYVGRGLGVTSGHGSDERVAEDELRDPDDRVELLPEPGASALRGD